MQCDGTAMRRGTYQKAPYANRSWLAMHTEFLEFRLRHLQQITLSGLSPKGGDSAICASANNSATTFTLFHLTCFSSVSACPLMYLDGYTSPGKKQSFCGCIMFYIYVIEKSLTDPLTD